MAEVADLLAEVHAADEGPHVVAAFDYDGTLIAGYSASAFYEHRMRKREIGPAELARTLLASARGIHGPEDFAEFLDLSLGAWKGRPLEELEELGEHLFKTKVSGRLHHEVWQLAQAHRRMGHTIVLVSSATRFQVEPMARELDADHVLCTQVELDDEGRLTGVALGTPLWGLEKAEALEALAEEDGLDLDASFAYSNGFEDVPLLEAVGHPLAVTPEAPLRAHAEAQGWPVLDATARPSRPGVTDLARTGALYGAFATALGAGLGVGLLRRSRTAIADLTSGMGADLGLALAGVDLEVVGQEHLWSARPCVFVFNHQSNLDPIVVMKLLRSGYTGVAKAEAKNIPVFGLFFQIAGVAFVSRAGNPEEAKQALAPAVAKVRDEGLSLAIAPEGTRTPTPRLAPFKKGAFHIAMQAQVPVVPIVLRNTGELMPSKAETLSGGRVQVAVLAPVDSSGWTPQTAGDAAAEVHELMAEALADWPGDHAGARPAVVPA